MTQNKHLINNIDLVRDIIEFYHLECLDKNKYEGLKNVCKETIKKRGGGAYETGMIDIGFFSALDFFQSRDFFGKPNSVPYNVIYATIKLLHENDIISPFDFDYYGPPKYKWRGNEAHFLQTQDLIVNVLFGFQYIVERYKDSVILLEVTDENGDKAQGTGFYCKDFTAIDIPGCIITNKHVVEGAKGLTVFDRRLKVLKHSKVVISDKFDLALIFLGNKLSTLPLILDHDTELLSEIVTIGFPRIPRTIDAYQTCHKGEINSIIEQDFDGQELFIFSAKTSSGNSGSPVINKYGMVVGIVTQELFEQNSFKEQGKLPYYAAIPSKYISQFICFEVNKPAENPSSELV